MEITFLNPKYLWLLLTVPLLILTHLFALRYLRTKAWLFSNFEAIKRVTGHQQSFRNTRMLSKNIFLLIIQLLVVIALIFSVAGTTIWYIGPSSVNNFVLAIDASASMLADDFFPDRLEVAKESAKEFIDTISAKTKIGIVSFSGTSEIDIGLTDDFQEAKKKIDDISVKRIGGTDLGEAIITSANVLLTDDKARVIVLLTDGRDTVGTEISEAVSYVNEKKVIVHTIGVGTEQGGSFVRTNLISTLDEETLENIASRTGGEYFRADDKETLLEAYRNIATFTKERIPIHLQLPLLLISLALIFLEWGLINTRYRTLP